MSPTAKDYYAGFWQVLTGRRTRFEQRASDQRKRDISPYLDLHQPLHILDLANGRLRPQYILLKAEGQQVVGLDLVNKDDSFWMDRGYRLARWFYAVHVPLKSKPAREDLLVCGNAIKLPFSNNSFDLVTSIAAFEHFLDVPSVIREVHRVLKPEGIAWIGIHPFTCPSGGHNVSVSEIPLRSVPIGIEPWDHLRQRKLPITVPLNEWRISQYLNAFSTRFQILKHYCVVREGENFLTPEIQAELADYTRDELTCQAYIIVARKEG